MLIYKTKDKLVNSASKYCRCCIRECRTGSSFCNRIDEAGNLKYKNRFCAILVDYLFEKPVLHLTDNVKVLSIGSWGCNLRCLGCQNAKLSWTISGKDLGYVDMGPEEVVELAIRNECKGICYTYNEPAIILEVVEEIASKAKEAGLFNILVTNSTLTPYSTKRLAPLMDAIAADIKSMNDDFYYGYCGAVGISHVAEKILECIQTFHDMSCHIEVRTNIIPCGNDQEKNFCKIARWIRINLGKNVPWHLTRFFPAHELSNLPKTPTHTLLHAQQIGFDEKLEYVYTYFNKSCDCAKDKCMIGNNAKPTESVVESCCK